MSLSCTSILLTITREKEATPNAEITPINTNTWQNVPTSVGCASMLFKVSFVCDTGCRISAMKMGESILLHKNVAGCSCYLRKSDMVMKFHQKEITSLGRGSWLAVLCKTLLVLSLFS